MVLHLVQLVVLRLLHLHLLNLVVVANVLTMNLSRLILH